MRLQRRDIAAIAFPVQAGTSFEEKPNQKTKQLSAACRSPTSARMGGMGEFDGHERSHASLGPFNFWAKSRDKAGASFHALPYHGLDAAAVMDVLLEGDPARLQRLAACFGMASEPFRRLLIFAVGLHDIGKFGRGFQAMNGELFAQLQPGRTGPGYGTHHSALGAQVWRHHVLPRLRHRFAHDDIPFRTLVVFLDLVFGPAFGHHGRPVDVRSSLDELHFPKEVLTALDAYVDAAADLFLGPDVLLGPGATPTPEARLASWEVAGLVVLADWLGSDVRHFPYRADEGDLQAYWEYAWGRAEEAVAASGLRSAAVNDMPVSLADFDVAGEPTPMQAACLSVDVEEPALVIIEDMTGSGKTEAAVLLAHRFMATGHARGLYVGLPTMASADSLHQRLRRPYRALFQAGSDPSLALAHSRALVHERFRRLRLEATAGAETYADGPSTTKECSAWIADSRKKSMLAQVGVGSIDQAVLAALPVKHQSLRVLGLSDKVLVVDEVHAYDARLLAVLGELIAYLGRLGRPVILLSATLPARIKEDLVRRYCGHDVPTDSVATQAYPALTVASQSKLTVRPVEPAPWSRREIEIRRIEHESEGFDVLRRAAAEGCACWIRNTVDDAIEAYRHATRVLGLDALLLHSRFTSVDRQTVEEIVQRRAGKRSTAEDRRGFILIATQVVEQSLDLDFDAMVSDLCPMDLVLQRAGRLRRHPREGRAGAIVLHLRTPLPKEDASEGWFATHSPKAARVYEDEGMLWLTARLLLEKTTIQMPSSLRSLIEGVYGTGSSDEMPPSLAAIHDEAWGKEYAQYANGVRVALPFAKGYPETSGSWNEDETYPTRMGEPTVTLRLCTRRDGRIMPLHATPYDDWSMNEVRVAQYIVPAPVETGGLEDFEQEALKAAMPDGCRHAIPLLLLPNAAGTMTGSLRCANRVVHFEYGREGLCHKKVKA